MPHIATYVHQKHPSPFTTKALIPSLRRLSRLYKIDLDKYKRMDWKTWAVSGMGLGLQRQLAAFQLDAMKSETRSVGQTSRLTFCVVAPVWLCDQWWAIQDRSLVVSIFRFYSAEGVHLIYELRSGQLRGGVFISLKAEISRNDMQPKLSRR